MNTKLRTAVENKLGKNILKLMNSSAFGKTIENVRDHKDMKLATSLEKYAKYVMKPDF